MKKFRSCIEERKEIIPSLTSIKIIIIEKWVFDGVFGSGGGRRERRLIIAFENPLKMTTHVKGKRF